MPHVQTDTEIFLWKQVNDTKGFKKTKQTCRDICHCKIKCIARKVRKCNIILRGVETNQSQFIEHIETKRTKMAPT
jgi:hypothetical protein